MYNSHFLNLKLWVFFWKIAAVQIRSILYEGSGSPKVTQSLGFGSGPSDLNPSLEIVSQFKFISRDVCAPLQIDYSGFESDGSNLKLKNWVTSLDLNCYMNIKAQIILALRYPRIQGVKIQWSNLIFWVLNQDRLIWICDNPSEVERTHSERWIRIAK